MRIRRMTAALATATTLGLAASTLPATAAPPTQAKAQGETSLATVLAADGNRFDRNWRDFDIVDRAVRTVLAAKPGSAVGVLADGSVRLTAFIPTDAAFRRLVHDLTGKWYSERGTFKAVASTFDVDTIESVLLYHVVPGATITYRKALRSDGARLQTALDGASLGVRVHHRTVRLADADRDDRNPRVKRSQKDLNKGNKQIAHGITQVLRPVDLP